MRISRGRRFAGALPFGCASFAGVVVVACGLDRNGDVLGVESSSSPEAEPVDGAAANPDVGAAVLEAASKASDGSACVLDGGATGMLCLNKCVDPFRDRANCGACTVACNVVSACEGSCVVVAAALAPFRVELPCTDNGSPYCTTNGNPPPKTATLTGTTGKNYDLELRFRGIVEQKTYNNTTSAGAAGTNAGFLAAGGTPATDGWNDYSLTVSSPALTLRINRGSTGNAYVERIDYTATVRTAAGAVLTFLADPNNTLEVRNRDTNGNAIVVPDILPAPNPFNGQFVQIDVTAVLLVP